jgi:hypothetical protein
LHLSRRDTNDAAHRSVATRTMLRIVRSVVEVNGIEPMTSCLQSRRSPN